MKTVSLEIEDSLYEHLLALLKQLPPEKIRIIEPTADTTESDLTVNAAVDYVLEKNKELYRRLS